METRTSAQSQGLANECSAPKKSRQVSSKVKSFLNEFFVFFFLHPGSGSSAETRKNVSLYKQRAVDMKLFVETFELTN
jgi:hypothetical protein